MRTRASPQAGASDYAEWIGWLAPIVDRLVVQPTVEPLEAALAALREPGAMRRTHPSGRRRPGSRPTWRPAPGRTRSRSIDSKEAERLTSECGMRFENAAIALERAEHATCRGEPADAGALARTRATFAELGATPWLARAERVSLDLQGTR